MRYLAPPDGGTWVAQAGLLLIAVRAAALPVVFDPRAAVAFEIPKAAASRAILYPLVALLLVHLVRTRSRPDRLGVGLILAGGLVVALNALATLTAADTTIALHGAPARQIGLVTLLDNVTFALAVAVFVRTRRDLLIAGTGAVLGSIVVLLYGAAQYARVDPIEWTGGPLLSSTVGNTGPLAEYLFAVAFVSAALLVAFRGRLAWWQLLFGGTYALAGLAMTALTGTRAWLVASPVVALASGAALWPHVVGRSIRYGVRAKVIVGIGLAILAIVAVPAGERALSVVRGGDASSTERSVIYEAAASAVAERPILGWGPDNFVVAYPRTRPLVPRSAAVLYEDSPHSWILKEAVSARIFGLLAFGFLAAIATTAAFRSVRQHPDPRSIVALCLLTAFLVVGAVTTSDISTEWIFWTGVGLAAPVGLPRPERATRRDKVLHRSASADVRDITFAVLAVVGGVMVSTSAFHAVTASQLAKVADRTLASGNTREAQAAAEASVAEDPKRGVAWNLLGSAHSAMGRSDDAIRAMTNAVRHEPFNVIFLVNLANEELQAFAQGRKEMGVRAVEHARLAARSAPGDPFVRRSYARVLQILAREPDAALAEVEQLLRWDPNDLSALRIAVQVDEQRGNYAGAASWQRRVDSVEHTQQSRLRLARLLVMAGDTASARSLVAPPIIAGVDRGCVSVGGIPMKFNGPQPVGCIRVLFRSEEALVTDSRPVSALERGNYRVDGRPLPEGSVLIHETGVQNSSAVIIVLPAGAKPPATGMVVTVTGVTDRLGAVVQPDPTVVVLQ